MDQSDFEHDCEECLYFRTRLVEGREYVGCLAGNINHVGFDTEPCEMFREGRDE